MRNEINCIEHSLFLFRQQRTNIIDHHFELELLSGLTETNLDFFASLSRSLFSAFHGARRGPWKVRQYFSGPCDGRRAQEEDRRNFQVIKCTSNFEDKSRRLPLTWPDSATPAASTRWQLIWLLVWTCCRLSRTIYCEELSCVFTWYKPWLSNCKAAKFHVSPCLHSTGSRVSTFDIDNRLWQHSSRDPKFSRSRK